MNYKKTLLYNVLKIGNIVVLIAILTILITSYIIGYEEVINNIMVLINYSENNRNTLVEVLSPSRLSMLQYCMIVMIVMCVVIIYHFDKTYERLRNFCAVLWQSIANILKDIWSLEGAVAISLPILATIYFAVTIPVSHDESFTYLTFTQKPFFYCLIFYPYPNNHVLHSFLTNIVEYLPFLSILFKLRMVAVIASMCTWMVAYSFVKKYSSAKLALLVIGISSVLYMSIYYGFVARGYSLLYLFFIISLYATCNIITQNNRKKDWIYFSISSILGFYAIPTFLYPFVTLNIIILIYNYKRIKSQFIYNTIVVIGVVLSYMPIVLVDGLNTLVSNKFVIPIARKELVNKLPAFLIQTLEQLFFSTYIIFSLIVISCILLFYNKIAGYKKIGTIWFIFLVSPILFLVIQSTIPFSRTFLYYGFVFIFLIAISFKEYINKMPNVILCISILIVQIILVVNFNNKIREKEVFDMKGKEVNNYLLKEADKTYFLGHSYWGPSFEFECIVHGYDVRNVKRGYEVDVSADSLLNYDYVIIDTYNDHTVVRKPVFSNTLQTIYKRE